MTVVVAILLTHIFVKQFNKYDKTYNINHYFLDNLDVYKLITRLIEGISLIEQPNRRPDNEIQLTWGIILSAIDMRQSSTCMSA